MLSEDQKVLCVDITFDDSGAPESTRGTDYGNMPNSKTHLGL